MTRFLLSYPPWQPSHNESPGNGVCNSNRVRDITIGDMEIDLNDMNYKPKDHFQARLLKIQGLSTQKGKFPSEEMHEEGV